jgi:hypothetical protein
MSEGICFILWTSHTEVENHSSKDLEDCELIGGGSTLQEYYCIMAYTPRLNGGI